MRQYGILGKQGKIVRRVTNSVFLLSLAEMISTANFLIASEIRTDDALLNPPLGYRVVLAIAIALLVADTEGKLL